MRAKQVPRDCGNELVSPSGESNYDCHKEASEQLKPIGANDGVEMGKKRISMRMTRAWAMMWLWEMR